MNALTKSLKESFIESLSKTADVLNVSSDEVINSFSDKINSIFNDLDEICTEFGKTLLNQPVLKEEIPQRLNLFFCGIHGGKIYFPENYDSNSPLVVNDQALVFQDIAELLKSDYFEDIELAKNWQNCLQKKKVITLKEYRK